MQPSPPPSAVRRLPSAERRSRWYAIWRGRFPGVPFRVTLRFTGSFAGDVLGRIAMLLISQTFTGRVHRVMLVFRWRTAMWASSWSPMATPSSTTTTGAAPPGSAGCADGRADEFLPFGHQPRR